MLQSMGSQRVGHDCATELTAKFEEPLTLRRSHFSGEGGHRNKSLKTLGRFPGGASGEEPTRQRRRCKRLWLDPWVGKLPWRREWLPTPVFLPGGSHGQRRLADTVQFSSVQFSCSVMSDSLRPQGPQHTRPPYPSPTPRVYSDSHPLSW